MSDTTAQSLFLSSDARPRYAQDVLAALALPRAAVLQFRYAANYVDPALRDACSNQSIVGRRCLLAYVSQRSAPMQHLVPVRYAEVVGVDAVADLFVFRFRLDAYPDLTDWALDVDVLAASARSVLNGMMKRSGGPLFMASFRTPRLPYDVGAASDDAAGWIEITRRLATVPTFARCHFVKLDAPRSDSGTVLPLDEHGEVTVTEGQSLSVRLTYYCDEYYDAPKQINAETLGDQVKMVSTAAVPVSSRYDNVEFRLHAQPAPSRAFSRFKVTMTASEDAGDVPTVIDFPITVRPSRRDLLLRVATSGIGALAVAAPAILGSSSDLGLRLGLATAGALLIAFSTATMARRK